MVGVTSPLTPTVNLTTIYEPAGPDHTIGFMSGTEDDWTFTTLLAYIGARLDAIDRILEERHSSAAARFTTINNLIEQIREAVAEQPTRIELDTITSRLIAADQRLTDDATEYLRKDEYQAAHQRLIDQIDELKAHDDARAGERQQRETLRTRSEWTLQNLIVGVLGIAALLINILHK